MNIVLSQQDPDDPQVDVESERSRLARRAQTEQQLRSDEIACRRAARLDKYFSQHPPNGPQVAIFRDVLEAFKNTNGEMARWLTYEHLEACISRLQKAGILTVSFTEDARGCRTYQSVSTRAPAKRRNVRPAEIDTIVKQYQHDISDALQEPALALDVVHGCQQITVDRWRVKLYIGGFMRALGCYPYETAIRTQDALTFHFSSYRQSASYNTSAVHAAQLLLLHPALLAFVTGLEKHWLDTGVISTPGQPIKSALEIRVEKIELQLDNILKAMNLPSTNA